MEFDVASLAPQSNNPVRDATKDQAEQTAPRPTKAIAPQPTNPLQTAIQALLENPEEHEAEAALGQWADTEGPAAVEALAEALEAERDVNRMRLICLTLNHVGTETSFGIFRAFLSRPENQTYAEHLGNTMISLENEELSDEALDWLLNTDNYDIAMGCQDAVRRLATAEAVARIIAEHSHTNHHDYILGLARTALENSECPEAVEMLREVLENPAGRPSIALQAAAAKALANAGTRPAIDALVAALEKSTRNPGEDFLATAAAGLSASFEQAYLQDQFDRATSLNVKYALGLALAGARDPIPFPESEAEEEPLAPVSETVGDSGLPVEMETRAEKTGEQTAGMETDAGIDPESPQGGASTEGAQVD